MIEEEINTGTQFARLRQMYQSMILAFWFKNRLKKSLMGQIYVDKENVTSLLGEGSINPEDVYQNYLMAYQKGVYDQIKEEYDPITQSLTTKRYFAGGGNFGDHLKRVVKNDGTRKEGQRVINNKQKNLSAGIDPEKSEEQRLGDQLISDIEFINSLSPNLAWTTLAKQVKEQTSDGSSLTIRTDNKTEKNIEIYSRGQYRVLN